MLIQIKSQQLGKRCAASYGFAPPCTSTHPAHSIASLHFTFIVRHCEQVPIWKRKGHLQSRLRSAAFSYPRNLHNKGREAMLQDVK